MTGAVIVLFAITPARSVSGKRMGIVCAVLAAMAIARQLVATEGIG
ncbi:hypothetical protein ACU8OR_27840 (plasmid) [Rhizobium leguminosarum]